MDTADRILPELESMLAQAEAVQKQQRENAELRNQFLRNLRACYSKALKDPDTRIPSYLQAALENVMALIPEPASTVNAAFATTIAAMCGSTLDKVNAYAEQGMRRDQRERYEGRSDQDRDIAGRPIKAGT